MSRRLGVDPAFVDLDLFLRVSGLVAVGISVAMFVDLLTLKPLGYDLAAYVLGARRILNGEPLYPADLLTLGPFGQFLYPPPVALLFVPLALLKFSAARLVVFAVLLAVAAAVTIALVRPLRPATRYWAAAAAVMFFPLIWEIGLENVTLITLALCLAAWHFRARSRTAGFLLSAALGLKLLPLALIPFFLANGRVRLLLWGLVAWTAIVIVSWRILESQWIGYVTVLRLVAGGIPASGPNVVPAIFAELPVRLVLPLLALIVAAACGHAARQRASEEHAFRVALAVVPLVASTLWYPYLVFALPLLLADAPRPSRPAPGAALRAARPAAWLLMQWQAVPDGGRAFVLPFVGLLLLLAVGLVELWIIARVEVTGVVDPPRPAQGSIALAGP